MDVRSSRVVCSVSGKMVLRQNIDSLHTLSALSDFLCGSVEPSHTKSSSFFEIRGCTFFAGPDSMPLE